MSDLVKRVAMELAVREASASADGAASVDMDAARAVVAMVLDDAVAVCVGVRNAPDLNNDERTGVMECAVNLQQIRALVAAT